jgi:hypothetical protein
MTAKELRDKYEADLAALQDSCEHTETELMDHYWAPGHYVGQADICSRCGKIVKAHWYDNSSSTTTSAEKNYIVY